MKTVEELKVLHDARQVRLSKDQICIQEEVVLNVHPKTRYGFEFFSYRSPEMTIEMSRFIEYVKGRKCLLDIGALHGIFALTFTEVNKSGLAYAFEPEPTAYALLAFNASVNPGNIFTCPVALSEEDGTLMMDAEWEHYVVSENGVHKANCKKGDNFCKTHGISPDTLKIDVEGAEFDVLRGLRETITANHPMIFLELHPERMVRKGDSVQELLDMIYAWEYEVVNSGTGLPISYEEILSVTDRDLRLILS